MDGSKAKEKRSYAPPQIVSSTPAFEHAILACTGKPSGSSFCNSAPKPKGNCLTTCIANS